MNRSITLEVPESIVNSYSTWDDLKHSIYESMIIGEFQKGFLSIRESAQLLGLTYEGFLEWLGEQRLPFINADSKELEGSYHDFEAFMQNYEKP